ncbi:DNA polymerase III subunit alpha [Mammaliicoccus vitulinus]|uniref:DNA-directed DNA polymerase n=1 Tax=Mammaliicoccus vitulinus TaxID=71237 RepID=A0ABX7HF39_9STAP|nr:DNA polymerase III subunit alpha [Mammaliicoccus vitulinus]PNZ39582.1 DNA polymerase III subunit alpha [Mammaliicoccus vitulinus]QRO84529.1 DNA polymerase III subunit alpha [Mammaliicoccus vitulinus]
MVSHLNIHSSYDLLNSSIRISDVVKKAKNENYQALALTDLNVMHGALQFYDECIKENIKPIFGLTIYLDDQLNQVECVVLAKNNIGYHNLIKLSSALSIKERFSTPVEWLNTYSEGLIIIAKHLGPDNAYLFNAISIDDEDKYLSHDSTVDSMHKNVYIKSTLYLNQNDGDSLIGLKAIKNNEKLTMSDFNKNLNHHFLTNDEIAALDVADDYIQNSDEIAQKCHVEITYHQDLLPKFKTPENKTSNDYLWELLLINKEKYPQFNEVYEKRLKYEYDIIISMGYADYFLIVSDLIQYAKEQGVLVGPGRGSSGGSLVSYILNITTIDPIEFDLLFERFLNPERVTMPDIDIDFQDTKRDKVIQYVQEKYGDNRVAGIVTYGHLQARAVARDVGRILQFDDATLNYISKLIPHKLGITLDEAYENEEFQQFVSQNHLHEKWFELSKQLEGLPRHTSTHAAGIIINDQSLHQFIPTMMGDTGVLTQWTMTETEKIGLLKIDFLGLRNLSIIQQVVNQVKYQEKQSVDIEKIPFDDPKVFQLLSKGETTGIFQLESQGVRSVLKRLKPDHFLDIVAVTSLYRPGPMEEIPTYIKRRRQNEKIEYLHPDLESILKSTYGVIIYQEQIMQIASKFAGFSYGEADILRRAMSKKNRAALENERKHFVNGNIKRGYEESTAIKIFDLILKFADYGYPKAHAVAYSKIAYIMTFLKVHYPTYFYAAILSNVVGNEVKTEQMVTELKRIGVKIYPPSINHSEWFYKATSDGIYTSLGAIKSVGYQSVKSIVDERKTNGQYKDMYDIVHRLPSKVKSKKMIQALIYAGSLDDFGQTRATMLQSIDDIYERSESVGDANNLLAELGLNVKKEFKEVEEMPDLMKSEYEKEYLGFYATEHPILSLFKQHQYLSIYPIGIQNDKVPMLVMISSLRKIRTKKGQNMAFVNLIDGVNEVEGVIFPDAYKLIESTEITNVPIIIRGKFEKRNGKTQIIINGIETLDAFKQQKLETTKEVVVRNITTLDEWVTRSEASDIKVTYFNDDNYTSKSLGYLNLNKGNFEEFINIVGYENVRLL